jgi:hypothetical protein
VATFTAHQLRYLVGQRVGRLATIDGERTPQNSPVGSRVADDRTDRIYPERMLTWGLDDEAG